MLGKLLKYEWKATAKIFVPLYIASFIITVLTRIFTSLPMFKSGVLSLFSNMFTLFFIFMSIALFVVAFVAVIYRFYKNMLTDEGYLMHTLPVTPAQHILAKGIVSFCWVALSFIVFFLSLFILLITPEGWNHLVEVFRELPVLILNYNMLPLPALIIEFIFILIASLIYYILFVYASFAIGQLFTNRKLIGAFAAAIILNVVSQVISFAAFIPFINTQINGVNDVYRAVQPIMLMSMALVIIQSVAYFIITRYVLKKKLNLQ